MVPIKQERYRWNEAMTTPHDQQIRAHLRDRNVRLTRGRELLIRTLAGADGPRSAAELHDQLADHVPMSSLYRSLAVLADVDVLARHNGPDGVVRFELAEWLAGHHHHLVCRQCGAVDDIELTPDHEAALEALVADIPVGAFRPSGHALEIDGRCGECT